MAKEPIQTSKFSLVAPGEAHPILRRRESDLEKNQELRILKLNSQRSISEFLGQNVDISGSTQLREKFSRHAQLAPSGRYALDAPKEKITEPGVITHKRWDDEVGVVEPSPFDKDGFGSDGFNKDGFNRYGLDRFGFNIRGYDQFGFDPQGYDDRGRDKYGLDKSGRREDDRD